MLIEPQGIKNLDGEHRRQLGSRGLRRKRPAPAIRAALAGTLVAWATRRTRGTRAAPNKVSP